MENEAKAAPVQYRTQMLGRLRNYRRDVDQMSKDVVKMLENFFSGVLSTSVGKAGLHSTVGSTSDCRSGGHKFKPSLAFMEIDQEIISMVTLPLELPFLEGWLSVSDKSKMYVQVNRLVHDNFMWSINGMGKESLFAGSRGHLTKMAAMHI